MSPSFTTGSEGRKRPPPPGIALPNGTEPLPVCSVWRWLVRGIFVMVCAGTGVIDVLAPVPLPELVGAERSVEERLRRSARIADGTVARLSERHLRLRSRVRQVVTPEYGFALYRWLHEVRPDVIYGKDGWLFIRSRALPRRVMDDTALSLVASQIAVISHRMADFGSQLVMVPIPRKAVLCANRLPSWCDSQIHVDSVFIAKLQENGVLCVDLLAALRASTAAPYYYMRGSHWTDESRIVAAEEICRVAGILTTSNSRSTRIEPLRPGREDYDNLEFGGVVPNQRIKRFLARTTSPRYRVVTTSPVPEEARAIEERCHPVLVGTSFSRGLLHDLLHHYSQLSIERHAERGGIPLDTFASILERSRGSSGMGDLPDMVILELPLHEILEGLESEISSLLGLLQSPRVIRLPGGSFIEIADDLREGHILRQRQVAMLTVRRGRLAHMATGSLGVRFAGSLTGGDALVDADTGSGRTTVRWTAGQGSLIVPLLGTRPSESLRISVRAARQEDRGDVHATVHAAQIVAYGTVRSEWPGRIEPTIGQRDGWYQEINVNPPHRGDGGLLEIRLAAGGAFSGRLAIHVPAPGDDTDVVAFQHLTEDAVILLDVPVITGGDPWTVRVTGAGLPPGSVVASARLLCLTSPDAPPSRSDESDRGREKPESL